MIEDVRAQRLTTSVRLNLFMAVALGLALGSLVHQTKALHDVRSQLSTEKVRTVIVAQKLDENIDKQCVAWLFNDNMRAAINRACGRKK